MTNVLMVLLDKSFPPDIRVEKEASSLLEGNYNVFLLTRREKKQAKFETLNGIRIVRLNWPLNIQRRLVTIMSLPILSLRIVSLISKHNIRILHVHDLSYALLTAILGKIWHRKVIFDMHENYTGMIEPLGRNPSGLLLMFYTRFTEIISCKFSAKIITATPEIAERIISLGISATKIVVLSNVPDISLLNELTKDSNKKRQLEGTFVISYVGGFSSHRGLDTLVNAMPLVMKKNPSTHLFLVGDGKMKPILQRMVDRLKLNGYVTFTGWVPFDEAMEYVQLSDLGIIPYHSTAQTHSALPHKIFQYMFFKKPVLVSNVKLLKKMVETTKCGLVFPAGDHNQLAQRILEVAKNRRNLARLGENGYKAVVTEYNWDREKTKLMKMYDEIVES